MKHTATVQKFIDEYVDKYCKYLEIKKPDILYKALDAKRWCLEIHPEFRWGRCSYLGGVAWKSNNTIFLNLRLHYTLNELQETIAHELIHLRYKTRHGKWFSKKEKEVLKNG